MDSRFQIEIKKLKEKALSTEVKPWRKIVASIFMLSLVIGTTVSIYMMFPDYPFSLDYHLYPLIFLIPQLFVIFYLLVGVIPNYARGAITLTLLFSNMWFGLFVMHIRIQLNA
jgi:hypothetical protein